MPAACRRRCSACCPPRARPDADGRLDNAVFGEEAREWAFAAFREALRPLADAGKLGYVLFQMAPWVKYGDRGGRVPRALPARLPGVTIAVEFRDASWLPAPRRGDARPGSATAGSPTSRWTPRVPRPRSTTTVALTSPTAILRLHGRNREGFMKQLRGQEPSVAEKYGYLYEREELAGIVARGRALEGRARRVYFKLNNNVGDAPAHQRRGYPGAAGAGDRRPRGGRAAVAGAAAGSAPGGRPEPPGIRVLE